MKVLVINCSPVRNGATAEIVRIVIDCLEKKHNVKNICIDDYDINFCKGCRTCHTTAKCVQKDDVDSIIEQYEWADIIISVLHRIGQIYRDNLNLLLIDVLLGATRMNHMQK